MLVVICGPTATGKTSLAGAIAQRLQQQERAIAVLSADSRQVYRGFDIGTAKPSAAEQAQVPHGLIDICAPTATLTLADYQQQAQQQIHHCHTHGILPCLVGGTGLYIKAIVRGLQIPAVAPQPTLRSQLQRLGQPQCYAMLMKVDGQSAQRIHARDQTRTLRALEVYYVTGQPLSTQQGEVPPDYPILQIGLNCATPDRLRTRIQARAVQMFEQGLVAEVEGLMAQYGADLPLLQTLGYQEARHYVQGQISYADAIAQTALRTSQFAKRQRTWFRADPTIHWFDSEAVDLVDQVWAMLSDWLGMHPTYDVRLENEPQRHRERREETVL